MWSPAKMPGIGDSVLISGVGGGSITLSSLVTVSSLTVRSSRLTVGSGRLTVSAVPPLLQYRLAVSKGGDGSGQVASLPGGIDCGTACDALFTDAQTVTLTASPSAGSVFTGWSDPGCPGTGQCMMTVNGSDTGVSATFLRLAADFSFPESGVVSGRPVQFSDLTVGSPTYWSWDFGDGSPVVTQQNPAHIYQKTGVYDVTITAGTVFGKSSVTKSVSVTAPAPFILSGSAVSDGGRLPVEYTIDGAGVSPGFRWQDPPYGTVQYALIMSTATGDPAQPVLWNWVLYGIPGTATLLEKNSTGIGTSGMSSHAVAGYAPPQSPGPGDKVYTFTLYALNSAPDLAGLDPEQVTGDVLAARIAPVTAGTASMSVVYARTAPVPGFSWTPVDTTVVFTSESGLSGEAWHWDFGDNTSSEEKSPIHTYSKYGTYQVTLTVSNGFGSAKITQEVTLASTAPMGMNNVQTISDGAQRTTLAFSAFAMMNGNLNSQSFFPPGKVADYTGFQYLRDNDLDGMGHNTSFLTRVAENVIYILDDEQFIQLTKLAKEQQADVIQYGYGRFRLMQAFRRLMDGTLPAGAAGLDLAAVKEWSRELYLIDGRISYDRALLYASVLSGMSQSQKGYLDAMKGKGWRSWPDTSIEGSDIRNEVRRKMGTLLRLYGGDAVAVMTYAGDLFSWYAGTLESDVYFCPERQGTYYGGFYMKDAPAIGHEGYAISTSLTADVGKVLSDSSKGYVTRQQADLMKGLVDLQRNNLYAGSTSIVSVRLQIATLLRRLLTKSDSDGAIRNQVMLLSGAYGDLDGENNYHYATVFAEVYRSLTSQQKVSLTSLYASLMKGTYTDGSGVVTGTYDFSGPCPAPFLYSAVISTGNPDFISNTGESAVNPLFGVTAQ